MATGILPRGGRSPAWRWGARRFRGAASACLLALLALSLAADGLAAGPADSPAAIDEAILQGVQAFRAGKHEEAVRLWEDGLRRAQAAQDPRRELYLRQNLGTAYLILRRFDQAVAHLEPALRLTRTEGKPADVAYVVERLGGAYGALGRPDKAIPLLQEAVQLSHQTGDLRRRRRALRFLGDVYVEQRDYVHAAPLFYQIAELAGQAGDVTEESEALLAFGEARYFLGEYAEAIAVLAQSLSLAHQARNEQARARALRGLGASHYQLRQLEKAERYFQEDLAIAKGTGDREREIAAHSNLGLVRTAKGEHAQAMREYEVALRLADASIGELTRGQLLLNAGTASINAQRYREAAAYLERAQEQLRRAGYLLGVGLAGANLGYAQYRLGQPGPAVQTLEAALTQLEEYRGSARESDTAQIGLLQSHQRAYRYLEMVLAEQGQPAEALAAAERGRAQAFLELVHRRGVTQPRTVPAAPSARVERVRQLARERHAALVEYSLVDETAALFIWVVRPDGSVLFRTSDLKPLAPDARGALTRLVEGARAAIGAGRGVLVGDEPPQSPLEELHRLLIAPIAELLPTDPDVPVVIAPDGPLFLVPFAALAGSDGHPLIERHTLAVAPSLEVLAEARAPAPPGGAPLIVGNPLMPRLPALTGGPGPQLPSLPAAEAEARDIARLLGTPPLLGAAATKVDVARRMPQASIIHLATHGLLTLEGGQGEAGAIALAPSRNDDGFLTSRDVLDLSLPSALVVLSACDTGRGHITGDGVVGLSRSFLAAGATGVVMSLWSIPDRPTAELMVDFYRALLRGATPAAALRQAMLRTRQRYPAQAAWAGFVVTDVGFRLTPGPGG